MSSQVRQFEAETRKILDLMIHSLYSNKDIFLRELLANAADAIDKARFLSLSNTALTADWEIRIEVDKTHNQLKIIDNGIGMTRDEVIENIGRVARSGTMAFLKSLEEKDVKDKPELIGQFGVGFYSAFMVADKVSFETRKAGEDVPAVYWESEGQGEYRLDDSQKKTQGTEITLHLKSDAKSYLEQWQLRSIVKKYSDFIEYPIRMDNEDHKPEDPKSEKVVTLNSMKAIWLRSPKEVTDDEYNQFFHHLSHAPGEPMTRIHYTAEGSSEFKALIYLPEKSPFDLFFYPSRKKTLHLYVRRVFITDECPGLLPDYLRFVSGVVDSADLPLNVSRETLQDNPVVNKISKNLTRKILGEIEKLRTGETERYLGFFKEFGRFIKEGVHSDYGNREKLQELLFYETMNNAPGKLISLKDYVAAMPAEQKDAYYLIGENRGALENSPLLEAFRAKGYDVLFMTDPIDEFVVQGMPKYGEKILRAIGKGEIDLGDANDKERKEKREKASKEFKTFLEFIQKQLDANVKEARFSSRLTDSACCLVGDAYDASPFMERIYKSMNQAMPPAKRIMEINPDHPLIAAMKKLYDRNAEDARLAEYAELLYDQALLTEGTPLPDPLRFSRRIATLMATGLDAR